MSSAETHRASRRFVVAQNVLLVLFMAIGLVVPKDLLFVSHTARLIGSVVAGVGVLLILLAVVSLRRLIQIAPEPKSNGELIQSGPYKHLRHPIYTGIILCVAGLFLRTPTIWIGIASLIVLVFLVLKARFEEDLLLERYAGYTEYRARTFGLFPGLRR